MASYTMHQGNKFYLIDDCDSLLTKFYNVHHDLFFCEGNNEQLDEIEAKIEQLEMAIQKRDIRTMRIILDEHYTMFKRYR